MHGYIHDIPSELSAGAGAGGAQIRQAAYCGHGCLEKGGAIRIEFSNEAQGEIRPVGFSFEECCECDSVWQEVNESAIQ